MFSTKNKEKVIGIVGGMGPYAGMDLQRKVFDSVDVHNDQDYPDVMMVSISRLIPDRSYYILHPDTKNPCIGISHCIQRLASMGATHIGIPCNTAHSPIIMNQVREYIEINHLDVQLFNIVEETHKYLKTKFKNKEVMLFATQGSYYSKVYQSFFTEDIKIVVPDDEDKEKIWNSIYSKEIGVKSFSNPVKDEAVDLLRQVTEKYYAAGQDTFIMGCTELPLAMGRIRLPINKIDPAKILARALVNAVCPEKLKAE